MPESAKDIFSDALELDASGRIAFVRRACGGDADLEQQVMGLLEAHGEAHSFMGAPTAEHIHTPGPEVAGIGEKPGDTIGPYKLVSVLGEGGFGRVFLAHQDIPVSRDVALKILKPGMDSQSIVTRFEAERQALAMMNHPNLARVFDGGQTESGRPYFVMEYVRGEPITAYCDRKQLDIHRRVALFESVCHAVQHAHQRGIIHRDLKPSNVLVAEVDDQPVVKVIDFGIAKAIGTSLTDQTLVTQQDQIIGTPAYMSPEQFANSELMDTRSDVYTLGVLLYELLTGVLPFEAAKTSKSFAALEKMILEETPPKPSTRVASRNDETTQRAAARHASPVHLARGIKGDLDWVVMMALEKEPTRRYPTAAALAEDTRRYLNDEPVLAGPPSGVYRLNKFVRRHRIELTGAAMVMLALVAGLITSLVLLTRLEDQRQRVLAELEKSDAIAHFTGEMLSGVDPAVARGADDTLFRRILTDASTRIEENPPDAPEAEVELRRLIGTAFQTIAAFDESLAEFQAASEIANERMGADHPRTLEIENNLGQLLMEANRYEEGEQVLRSTYERRVRVLGPDDPETLKTRFNVGVCLRLIERLDDAIVIFEEVYEDQARVLGEDNEDTMSTLNSLATCLGTKRDFGRSTPMFEKVIAFQERELGPDHPHTLATRNNVADNYIDVGEVDRGIAILEEVLEAKRRIYEPDHPSVLIGINNLAHIYSRQGRKDEATPMYREAAALARSAFGEDDWRTLGLMNNLASNLREQDELEEALTVIASAHDQIVEILPPEHRLSMAVLSNHVGVLRDLERFDEALPLAQTLMERAEEYTPDDLKNHCLYSHVLGAVLVGLDRPNDAEPYLTRAWTLVEAGEMKSPSERAKVAATIELMHRSLGDTQQADHWRDVAEASRTDD